MDGRWDQLAAPCWGSEGKLFKHIANVLAFGWHAAFLALHKLQLPRSQKPAGSSSGAMSSTILAARLLMRRSGRL